MKEMTVALRITLATLVFTGLLYPFAVTGAAQLLFRRQAEGSLVPDDKGLVRGSELIGQPFTKPGYFQPRPSAAGEKGWDATASSGSNFGATSKKLHERIAAETARLQKENPDAPGPVPLELVTASGSGLDPHLSPAAAHWQVARVAKARGVTEGRIEDAVAQAIEGRTFGLLGEPRVNVLLLNLALDRQFGPLPQ
jgi:K+-transporting ATPase ATPase C chain